MVEMCCIIFKLNQCILFCFFYYIFLFKLPCNYFFNCYLTFYRQEDLIPAAATEPPLKGLQILLIICGILFLSLILLGLGCSYYCIRKRNVALVRNYPFSLEGSESEITKLSGSSIGKLKNFNLRLNII